MDDQDRRIVFHMVFLLMSGNNCVVPKWVPLSIMDYVQYRFTDDIHNIRDDSFIEAYFSQRNDTRKRNSAY